MVLTDNTEAVLDLMGQNLWENGVRVARDRVLDTLADGHDTLADGHDAPADGEDTLADERGGMDTLADGQDGVDTLADGGDGVDTPKGATEMLSYTKCFSSRSAEFNFHTNPSIYYSYR